MAKRKGGNRKKSDPQGNQSRAGVMNVQGGEMEPTPDYSALVPQEHTIVPTSDPLTVPILDKDATPEAQQEEQPPMQPEPEAQEPEPMPDSPAIPDWKQDPRFAKGDPDAVYKSYRELESKLTELSEQNKTFSRFFDQHLQNEAQKLQQAQQPQKPDDGQPSQDQVQAVEQMLTDPKGFFNKMFQEQVQALRGQAMQNEVIKMRNDNAQTISSPEFKSWMLNNVPFEVAQMADRDPRHLKYVLDSYQSSVVTPQEATQAAQEDLASKAKVVQGAAGVPAGRRGSGEKVWTKAELANLMMSDPGKYAAMQPEIIRAYQEGRVK